jgi:hypothetical protein
MAVPDLRIIGVSMLVKPRQTKEYKNTDSHAQSYVSIDSAFFQKSLVLH